MQKTRMRILFLSYGFHHIIPFYSVKRLKKFVNKNVYRLGGRLSAEGCRKGQGGRSAPCQELRWDSVLSRGCLSLSTAALLFEWAPIFELLDQCRGMHLMEARLEKE